MLPPHPLWLVLVLASWGAGLLGQPARIVDWPGGKNRSATGMSSNAEDEVLEFEIRRPEFFGA